MTARRIPPGSLERVITDPAVIERVAIALYGIRYSVEGACARAEWGALSEEVRDSWLAEATGTLYEHAIDRRWRR